ncbi:MAG: DUF5317 domain-containing protein [Chloroflexales bacterium]|nr:DUF5317 domain-containing protein [Chloroflexales bacterium]
MITFTLILTVLIIWYGWAGVVRLAMMPLRGVPLMLLALGAQLTSIMTHQHRLALLLITAVLLTWFCWLNRRLVGVKLIYIGIALNIVVMAVNGGVMPISPATLNAMGYHHAIAEGTEPRFSKSVVLDEDRAILPGLSDRLLLPGPLAVIAAWSIGDVFLILGVSQLLWHAMRGPGERRYAC